MGHVHVEWRRVCCVPGTFTRRARWGRPSGRWTPCRARSSREVRRMSLALTAPLMVTVAVVAYTLGRSGRMPALGTAGPAGRPGPARQRPPRVPRAAGGVRRADRLGLGPIGLSAGRPAADRALADLERRVARLEQAHVRATAEAAALRAVADDAGGSEVTGASAEVVDHRAVAQRRDKHRAR